MVIALVRKYARSLADVALERGNHEKVKSDLSGFVVLCAQNSELRNILENPAIPFSAKRSVVTEIGREAGMEAAVVNFLSLLLQNNRFQLLSKFQTALADAVNEKLGIVSGEVGTVHPLRDDQRTAIEGRLAEMTGRKIRLDYRTESGLIGVVKIQLGSVVYDASVKKQLEEIGKQLA